MQSPIRSPYARFGLLAAPPLAFFFAAWALSARLPGVEEGPGAALLAAALCVLCCLSLLPFRRLPPGRLSLLSLGVLGLMLLRLCFFPVETSDFTNFLAPWTEHFRNNGGLAALGVEIGNYNVPYLFFLALFSYLDFPVLYLIKLLSVAFDLGLAVALGLLAGRLSGRAGRGPVCYLLALALPTVFINGAVWGQCDSIYGALAVWSLYLCLTDRPILSMAAIALSFAFKLQAVFLMPVFLLFLFAGKLKWYHLPAFPAVYTLAILPAVLAGQNLWDTLLFYLRSAASVGDGLNYNAASMYALPYFNQAAEPGAAAKAGIVAAFFLCLCVFLAFFLRRKRLTGRALYFAALLLVCGLPLLLPHMHDRYFFLCDGLALAAAFLSPAAIPFVPLSQFASLLGYYAYFRMAYLLPMRYGFFALVCLALGTAYLCGDALWSQPYYKPEEGAP